MIKNNLNEILGKLQDQNAREAILKKDMKPLAEVKISINNKLSNQIIPILINNSNQNFIKTNNNYNSIHLQPTIEDDRSFNLLKFDEGEIIQQINKFNNADLDKKIDMTNTFELDDLDISDLIKDQIEYDKSNNPKFIPPNYENTETRFNTVGLKYEKDNFNFQSAKNFNQYNKDNKFEDNFNINMNKQIVIPNLSDSFHEENLANIDLQDIEIDQANDKIQEFKRNSLIKIENFETEPNDNYVQEGDFEKIINKNYKLANLNEWKKGNYDNEIEFCNRHLFGFQFFRPNQREIINACMENRDTFVCMPTGGGKSLTFQIPGVLKSGVSIVIMPLLSLIQDQISILTGLGLKVLNLKGEGLIEAERNFDQFFLMKDDDSEDNGVKFIFITPEKFSKSPSTLKLLYNLYQNGLISRFVIDEAHCLSQWGREFRPDYMNLVYLRKRYPNVPISAITATATNKVRDDIINILGLRECLFFRSSYNRHNLYLEVRDKKNTINPISDIYEFIRENGYIEKTGIIYCSSKKECENVSKKLRELGLFTEFYHASMVENKRISIQEKWKNDEVKIIVATIAFGMGINKNDVRYVIHYNMPKSFENYYQEIGRAGRDGNNSHCLLYYQTGDRKTVEFLLSTQNLSLEMNKLNLRKINEVQEFCEELIECRRVLALRYFGENFKRETCHKMCDNCKKGLNKVEKDLTDYAYKICEFVKLCMNSGVKVTILILAEFLRGSNSSKLKKNSALSKSNFFGCLKDISIDLIKRLIRRLVIEKLLYENIVTNNYGSNCYVFIDDQGVFFVKNRNQRKFIMVVPAPKMKNQIYENDDGNEQFEEGNMEEFKYKEDIKENKKTRKYKKNVVDLTKLQEENINEEDYGFCQNKTKFEELLDVLKKKRVEIFKDEKEKSHGNDQNNADAIFPLNGLLELCRKLPESKSDLNTDYIYGVANEKLKNFGEKFLPDIKKFINKNQIVKKEEIVQKYASEKKNKEYQSSQKKLNTSSKKKESSKKDDSIINDENCLEKIRERYMNNSGHKNVKNSSGDKDNKLMMSNNLVKNIDLIKDEQSKFDEYNEDYLNNFQQNDYYEVEDDDNNNSNADKKDFEMISLEAKLLNKEITKRKKEVCEDDESVGGKKSKKSNNYFKNKFKWQKINQYRKKKKLL